MSEPAVQSLVDMVYTRSQTDLANAAKALLSLKTCGVTLTRYTSTGVKVVKPLAKPVAKPVAKHVNSQKLWSIRSIWYDSFVAEVEDESDTKMSRATISRLATDRWATFAARSLNCTEAEVRSWLKNVK